MKAVVTGATGLVGSHLVVDLLRDGSYNEIVALVRSEHSLRKLSYTLGRDGFQMNAIMAVELDMMCLEEVQEAFDGASVVFHTAAVVDLSGVDVVRENVRLTEIVVEACIRQTNRPVLVFTSSIAALSSSAQRIEDASPYSRSKFLSEMHIWQARKLGLDVGVVLPSVILGVGAPESGGLQGVVRMLGGGLPFWVSGGTGFVDVRDVSRALVRVAQNPLLRGGQRLVLNGANVRFRELAVEVAVCSGVRKPWLRVDKWLFLTAAWIMRKTMKTPPFSADMASFIYGVSEYDGSEICSLDNNFSYTPFGDTIHDVVRGLKSQNSQNTK